MGKTSENDTYGWPPYQAGVTDPCEATVSDESDNAVGERELLFSFLAWFRTYQMPDIQPRDDRHVILVAAGAFDVVEDIRHHSRVADASQVLRAQIPSVAQPESHAILDTQRSAYISKMRRKCDPRAEILRLRSS